MLSAAYGKSWEYRTHIKGENAEDDRQEAIRLIDESITLFKGVSCLNGPYSMHNYVTVCRM